MGDRVQLGLPLTVEDIDMRKTHNCKVRPGCKGKATEFIGTIPACAACAAFARVAAREAARVATKVAPTIVVQPEAKQPALEPVCYEI